MRLTTVNLTDPGARSITLNEDDRVYIRQMPNWQMHRTVRIDGEVMYPGEYVLSSREETLYSLLQRAGGLTDLAFARGTVFERPSVGENLERMQIPQLVKRSSPLVQDSLGNLSRTVLFEYDSRSMNRIVLDVDKLLATGGREGFQVVEGFHDEVKEAAAKAAPFAETEEGISSVETLLPASYQWVAEDKLDLHAWINALSSNPAKLLQLDAGHLKPGTLINGILFNPAGSTAVSRENLLSEGKNSPWLNQSLPGQVLMTLCDGHVSYRNSAVLSRD